MGIAQGECKNYQVVAHALKEKAYLKCSENKERVSIIKRISTAGVNLRCLVIFKGQNLQKLRFSVETITD